MNLQNADGSAMPMPEKEKSTNEKVCEALKAAFVEYAIYPEGIGLIIASPFIFEIFKGLM